MSLQTLEILWYLVFLIVIVGYVVLDGFDLGVGILHLSARGDTERRTFLNAIGPVWDGNEVWLVVLGGALFAGFPFAYATLLSAYYTFVMIFLAGLIFRAVAIEFRSKREGAFWRSWWDLVFSLGSTVIAIGLGLALGNLVAGLPLDAQHEFTGNFFTFLRPYPILVAVTTLFLVTMHGAIYLVMKTEGELHDRLRKRALRLIGVYALFYIALTVITLIFQQHMATRLIEAPWLFAIAVVNALALINIAWQLKRGNDGWAFLSSCLNIASLVVLYALGTFPNLIRDVDNVNSLTVSNSYASAATLKILLIIVLIGIPLVLAYMGSIYYVFRGKVKLDSHSY